jgi:hypothetical protein
MEGLVTFEQRNGLRVLHFNVLAIVITMKKKKRKYFLLPITKEATKTVP